MPRKSKSDREIEAFYAQHLAREGAVVLVIRPSDMAIFNSLEKAMAWADSEPGSNVISPYIINHPEFGNVQIH